MPLFVVTAIVQIALVIHAVRTGRSQYWVFILLMVPGLGALAYFIIELLPDLISSRGAQRAARNVRRTIDPGANIRQLEREHRLSGSVDATRHLAEELIASGRYGEAVRLYEEALTGLYEHDPDLLLGLAMAQFGDGRFPESRETLERLIEHNPEFRSPDGHLLYARAVEACGDDEKALEEYAAVAAYYAGAEARLRYGLILERCGRKDEAIEQFEEIVASAELAPRHYRRAQRQWIGEAKDGIRRLKG